MAHGMGRHLSAREGRTHRPPVSLRGLAAPRSQRHAADVTDESALESEPERSYRVRKSCRIASAASAATSGLAPLPPREPRDDGLTHLLPVGCPFCLFVVYSPNKSVDQRSREK